MTYQPPPWPQIIAHRGDAGPAPENTRLAIERAIKIGVDMVEVDVRLTKDGVPVLLHFERLEHTTTGSGLLADHTWEETQRLDAGAWRGPEFAGEQILSLADVLDLTRSRVPLNLDLKTSHTVLPGIDAVREAGRTGDVVLSGCKLDSLMNFSAATSGIGILFNVDELSEGIGLAEAWVAAHRSLEEGSKLGALGLNLHDSVVNSDLVASATKAGLGVWVFTVDDVKRVAELLDMGVTSVTTNWPARMLPLTRNRTSPALRGNET